MGIVDVLWMGAILGGAGYLFYRSFWKKKGSCRDCSGCDCPSKR